MTDADAAARPRRARRAQRRHDPRRDAPRLPARASARGRRTTRGRSPRGRCRRRVDWAWRMASFSGADRAIAPTRGPTTTPRTARRRRTTAARGTDLFTFPRGARAGSCLHAILERLDFAERRSGAPPRGGGARAARARLRRRVAPVVDGHARARPGDAARRRRPRPPPGDIAARADRLDELEFTYPLARLRRSGPARGAGRARLRRRPVRRVARRADVPATSRASCAASSTWSSRPTGATGWSTTSRTGSARRSTTTAPSGSRRRWPATAYWLQYLIYTVVLHRLLRLRLPGYDYDTHVGGVFYLFLRGMAPERGAAVGRVPRPAVARAGRGARRLDRRGPMTPRARLAALRDAGHLTDLDVHLADVLARLARDDAPALLWAAALVSHRTGDGHVCADLAAAAGRPLVDGAADAPVAPELARVDGRAARRRRSSGGPGDDTPLVLDDASRLYLRRYWRYEQELATDLRARAAAPAAAVDDARLRSAAAELLPADASDRGPDWQRVAAIAAVLRRLCVISGGPGTGKTSTVVRLLALLAAPGRRHAARRRAGRADREGGGAPRGGGARGAGGRAARALRAAIPEHASTVHRLLRVRPDSTRAGFDRDRPLRGGRGGGGRGVDGRPGADGEAGARAAAGCAAGPARRQGPARVGRGRRRARRRVRRRARLLAGVRGARVRRRRRAGAGRRRGSDGVAAARRRRAAAAQPSLSRPAAGSRAWRRR